MAHDKFLHFTSNIIPDRRISLLHVTSRHGTACNLRLPACAACPPKGTRAVNTRESGGRGHRRE